MGTKFGVFIFEIGILFELLQSEIILETVIFSYLQPVKKNEVTVNDNELTFVIDVKNSILKRQTNSNKVAGLCVIDLPGKPKQREIFSQRSLNQVL